MSGETLFDEPKSGWTGPLLLWLMSHPGIGSRRALSVAALVADPTAFSSQWDFHRIRLSSWADAIPPVDPEPLEPGKDVEVLGYFDAGYPDTLRRLGDAPAVVFVRGRFRPEARSVAVVGTRHPTEFGRRMAVTASSYAVEVGLGVVSGLALGCDTVAHKAALEAGGYTVAVLGGSLLTPEPASNRSLAERILESGGVLLSEAPPQVRPEPRTLVQRDRIQAALAEAVVVAQTGIPDGTLHTVRFAIEQGRALIVPRPSSPESEHPKSAGNLALTEEAGCDPAILKAEGQLAERIRNRRPVADSVPRTPAELKQAIGAFA
jgi:DNA protecting protein DprA